MRTDAEKTAREWRRYLQISQSHAQPSSQSPLSSQRGGVVASSSSSIAFGSESGGNLSSQNGPTTTGGAGNGSATAGCYGGNKQNNNNATLAGYLLKRSPKDPHVWKRHYCVLTRDDFWCVPRIVLPSELWPPRGSKPNNNNDDDDDGGSEKTTAHGTTRTVEIARSHCRIRLLGARLAATTSGTRSDGFEVVVESDRKAQTYRFRACPQQQHSSSSSSSSSLSGAATPSSIEACRDWKKMLAVRMREARDHSLTHLAELLLTEETVARTERWKKSVLGVGGSGRGSRIGCGGARFRSMLLNCNSGNDNEENKGALLRSTILRFGLDVAEYREGCRQVQTLLWADYSTGGATATTATGGSVPPASASSAMAAIRRLVRQLWGEASSLLDRAVSIHEGSRANRASTTATIASATAAATTAASGGATVSRSLETLCHHAEYIITQKRRRTTTPVPTAAAAATTTEASSSPPSPTQPHHEDGDYPHQRDPPPIDLFDLLWNELRTLG